MAKITSDISLVADSLQRNEVAAIPTETVYGLAGNIYSPKAIHEIFRIKQRPLHNPLIVHLPHADAMKDVATHIPDMAMQLAQQCWPGPLTLLLPRKDAVPDLITAGKPTVAVRVPDHATTLSLLSALPFPLAAPSANPFGSISPTSAQHVANYFPEHFPYILEGGPCKKGIESTIIGFNSQGAVLYRHGSLSQESIEAITGPLQLYLRNETAPLAPGMLLRHYAPATTTILTEFVEESLLQYEHLKIALLLFNNPVSHPSIIHQEILSPNGDLEEAAAHLYDAMHILDQIGADLIIAERFPEHGLGRSINDRLERATYKD
jgi:L-threonylcarbamoyladenylate synthase